MSNYVNNSEIAKKALNDAENAMSKAKGKYEWCACSCGAHLSKNVMGSIGIKRGQAITPLMPQIIDIKTYNEKVVKVWFADDTYETAIVSKDDTFNYEQGVSICLFKKILAVLDGDSTRGSYLYNKLMDLALDVPIQREKEKERQKKLKEEAVKEAHKLKMTEKINEERERDKRIAEMATAFSLALGSFLCDDDVEIEVETDTDVEADVTKETINTEDN